MQQLKRNVLSVALASATLMLATSAWAQTTTTTTTTTTQEEQKPQEQPKQQDPRDTALDKDQQQQLDTVTVVGIRAGIEDSILTKKESTSIVEAVSSEDIGKLPDISVAESIARLPGVAAQRVGGRAQVISVRGMSPDFTTTLLNGREMVSTGDNRSVEFDQYPSELMAGVTVFKTTDAGLVGQGLTGTIDMLTVRPLDFKQRVFAVSARGQKNSLGSAANADDTGSRFNFGYIDQYMGGQLGLALGYSYGDVPIAEEQTGLYEPWDDVPRVGVPDGAYITDGIKALRRTGYIRRNSMMGTLQFRPIDQWTSTLDVYYTTAMQEDTANQFESHFYYNGDYPCSPACTWTPAVNGNGTLVGGTVTNVYPLVRGMYGKREDDIGAVGWRNDIALGDIDLVTDFAWSQSHRNELLLENNTQLLPVKQLDTLLVNFNPGGFATMTPGRNYSDPNTLFLNNTIYGSGYGKTPRVVDELVSSKIAANFPGSESFDWFASYDVGISYSGREKSKRQPEGNINLGPQGATTIAPDLQYGLVDLGFAGVGFVPSWNVPGATARYMTFAPNEEASYLVSKAWTVNEDISVAFVKANVDTTWGSVGVRGNIGVQMQHTSQGSTSNYWDATQPAGSNVRPVEDGKDYTDWLPSMNLAFLFSHDQTLRLGLARQLARPRMDEMRASLEFGVSDAGVPGGAGGNPLLDPWTANAFDISYEKYWGTKAYVAAAYYYKDLTTYIYTQSAPYDFSKFIAQLPPDEVVTTNIGQFTAPYNGGGGMLQGLELSASIPLNLWWEALDGFGFQASATFNDSDITIEAPGSQSSVGEGSISLPGLSDNIYNLTAYYENEGFEARISQRKRSDFIGEVSNFSADRTLRYVVGEDITDAQVSYTFGDGSFNGVTLLFQAYNLTNSPYQTYAGTKDRPLENIEWGRSYLLGVSYRF